MSGNATDAPVQSKESDFATDPASHHHNCQYRLIHQMHIQSYYHLFSIFSFLFLLLFLLSSV